MAPDTLQITDAGGPTLPVDGAIFILITRSDKNTGIVKRTRQIAYLCEKTRDLVLSREAMADLGMVATGIDDAVMLRQISARATQSSGGDAEQVVAGGQLTRDLIASHNQSYPSVPLKMEC